MRDIRTTVMFDMRAPDWGTPRDELYAAALEMASFADQVGIDSIGLMEHHGSDDGYLPQPLMLAAAMAAVTRTIHFTLGAVILPLHDPIELAEQIAVADLISGGRISVIFGAGYVPSEFAMFGKSLADRAKLMESGVETILRALRGDRFEVDGRPVVVRPLPTREPEDIVLIGGGVPAAAKRAARFDVGLGPMNADLIDVYLQECHRLGREPRRYVRPAPGMPVAIHLCEDPDVGWAAIERHAVHVVTEYANWAEQEGDSSASPFRKFADPTVLRQLGIFAAWTPDELVGRIESMPDRSTLNFQPLLGGLSPKDGWQSLELLAASIPRLRAAIASAV